MNESRQAAGSTFRTGAARQAPAASTIPMEEVSERAWPRVLSLYRTPHRGRSLFELGATLVPFVGLWALAAIVVHCGFWWGTALTIPAAGFLLRLFMIQHDCGHGSFFAHRTADDWTGRLIGVLTFTPYDYWRRAHAAHHASAGNLEERGVGDITTLTVAEYRSLSRFRRLSYRFYRNPIVMFGIGPIWLFLFKQRLPFGMMRSGVEPWVSTMATNLGIVVLTCGLMWLIGSNSFILVQLPIVALAGSAGIWLFYVQHQFEETHWSQSRQWRFQDAALHGSSYYELPLVLRWLTANIGIHHVHHLSSRVPYYRLPEVLRDYPELRNVGHITIWESLRCVKLVLWDEHSQRLISFNEARAFAALSRSDIFGFAPAGLTIGPEIEGHFLTISKTPQAAGFEGRDVNEDIRSTTIRSDEAEAFGSVEELHCSCGHCISPSISDRSIQIDFEGEDR